MATDFEDDDNTTNIFHEFVNGDSPFGFAKNKNLLAECFGGPVDGSFLPVPDIDGERIEAGTIISGYNHNTGDMMHYRLCEQINDETGEEVLTYQFLEAEHRPDMTYDEFMRASEKRQAREDEENESY